jgi:hypothetical protein
MEISKLINTTYSKWEVQVLGQTNSTGWCTLGLCDPRPCFFANEACSVPQHGRVGRGREDKVISPQHIELHHWVKIDLPMTLTGPQDVSH